MRKGQTCLSSACLRRKTIEKLSTEMEKHILCERPIKVWLMYYIPALLKPYISVCFSHRPILLPLQDLNSIDYFYGAFMYLFWAWQPLVTVCCHCTAKSKMNIHATSVAWNVFCVMAVHVYVVLLKDQKCKNSLLCPWQPPNVKGRWSSCVRAGNVSIAVKCATISRTARTGLTSLWRSAVSSDTFAQLHRS